MARVTPASARDSAWAFPIRLRVRLISVRVAAVKLAAINDSSTSTQSTVTSASPRFERGESGISDGAQGLMTKLWTTEAQTANTFTPKTRRCREREKNSQISRP